MPGNYADEPQQFGTALDLRESFFLDNERTPAAVKVTVRGPSAHSGRQSLELPGHRTLRVLLTHRLTSVQESVLTIQPSAELDCTDCVKEAEGGAAGGGPLLLVPPMLTDAQLLPLLQQYRKVGAGVGSRHSSRTYNCCWFQVCH